MDMDDEWLNIFEKQREKQRQLHPKTMFNFKITVLNFAKVKETCDLKTYSYLHWN